MLISVVNALYSPTGLQSYGKGQEFLRLQWTPKRGCRYSSALGAGDEARAGALEYCARNAGLQSSALKLSAGHREPVDPSSPPTCGLPVPHGWPLFTWQAAGEARGLGDRRRGLQAPSPRNCGGNPASPSGLACQDRPSTNQRSS